VNEEKKSEEEEKKLVEPRKSVAQRMFEDMAKTIREKQLELEKAISDYTAIAPEKPTMDVIETEDSIIIKTDLPGVNKDDVSIDLTEDSVDIMAKFEEEFELEEANFIKKERRYGEARRSMVLPAKIKVDEATAKFENGVLTVELPKLEKKEKHAVKID